MSPKTLLIKAVYYMRAKISERIVWFRALSRRRKIAFAITSAILAPIIIFIFWNGGDEAITAEPQLRTIEQIVVSDYSTSGAAGVAVPTTQSGTFVVRAEAGGRVTRVVSSGTRVAQGAIVAELENSAQRAALLQSQGVVEAAEANLSKITGGARSEQLSILESNLASASASLTAARSSAVNAILSAFAAGDNALPGTTDKMFTNPRSNAPLFTVTSTDSQLTNKIENTRTAVEPHLLRQALVSDSLTPASNLASEISTTEGEIRAMRNFLDMIVNALNKGIPTSAASEATIASYLADTTAARTSLTTALSSLSSATQGIVSAESAVEVAKKNLEQGVSGGQSEDVAAGKASLKQAQGGLAAAQASYAKTLVRVPFSGTVTASSVAVGDIISVGSDVALVVPDEGVPTEASFALPLSSVKFTPAGAYVFTVGDNNTLQSIAVETGLVTANAIITTGLSGSELIVKDARGLKAGERVERQ